MEEDYSIPLRYCGLPTFFGFFMEHLEEIKPFARRSGWNEETTETYTKIIADKIVPCLENHDRRSILDYTKADYDNALERIKNAGKDDTRTPYDTATLKKYHFLIRAVVTVAARYGLSLNIYQANGSQICDRSPIAVKPHPSLVPKSLTPQQECAVANYLKKNLRKEGQIVGLFLMYALGLRNNEACAVQFGHIKEMSEYPGHFYICIAQSTKLSDNQVKLGGKSSNAARNIPISNSVKEMLFSIHTERSNQLLKADPNRNDFSDLYFACKGKDFLSNCKADDISEAGREMFTAIGMRQDELCSIGRDLHTAAAEVEETTTKEDALSVYEKDPTSYLLRRNFATHMFLLGLDEAEILYIIGHTMESVHTNRKDYTDEAMLMNIKRKLDKRPILNDIDTLLPLELVPGTSFKLTGSHCQAVKISINDLERVHLEATAKEPGAKITVRTSILNRNLRFSAALGKNTLPWSRHFPRMLNLVKTYQETFRALLKDDSVRFYTTE